MRIPRIFTPQVMASGSSITLEEQASTHLSRVLRLQEGNLLILFNGLGGQYSARISRIGKKVLDVDIGEHSTDNLQSSLASHIAIAVSKADKMDFIVQKCTELGVTAIYPVTSDRCDVKMDTDRWQKKTDRWQEIAISACEQSGRNSIPMVHNVQAFSDWLAISAVMPCFLFHPTTNTAFLEHNIQSDIAMAFGPEGGFSDNEIQYAAKIGASIAKLGPRVLRAETAPIAALAIAQSQWGDLSVP